MRKTIALALVLALAPAIAGEDDGIEWSRDLEAAKARAAREKKPLLVVFR